MARGVKNVDNEIAERKLLAWLVEVVDWRLRLDLDAEHPALFHNAVVEKLIVGVQPHIHAKTTLRGGDAGDVIQMRVRQENLRDVDAPASGCVEQRFDFVTGIDEEALRRPLACNEVAVLVEGRRGGSPNQHVRYHLAMVVAVVDDLLFSSKIRAVAQAAGAAVTFARSADAAVSAAGNDSTSLVIVDLESRSADAIEIVRSIRTSVRTELRIVGYGSHVNVERLKAARDAGCDHAMARSAFVATLPDLLASSRPDDESAI